MASPPFAIYIGGMFSALRLVACAGLLFLLAPAVHAACSNPTGDEGKIIYNKDYKIPQYCNGTHWVAWGSGYSSSGGSLPSGAVMAFDLTSCPSGWTEYAAAKGRFIRGVCLDGTGCNDPDGVRSVGSTQEDAFESHSHGGTGRHATPLLMNSGGASRYPTDGTTTTATAGGDETRPVNVALLYCEKD